MHLADAPDGLLERRPDVRVEHPDGGGDHVRRDAQVLRADAVEPLGEVAQLGGPARADGRQDRRDDLGGVLDVDLGTGELLQELTARQGATAQVDAGDHVPEHRTDDLQRGLTTTTGRAVRCTTVPEGGRLLP